MRPSIHSLLGELDELRSWMIEHGITHAKVGDLELHLDYEVLLANAPVPQPPKADLAAIERSGYGSIYDDPDLYAAVGGDPIDAGKQAGEAAMK